MIVDGIISFFASIFQAAYNALPTWTPTVDTQSVTALHLWLVSYDAIMPIHELENLIKLAAILMAVGGGIWAVMKVVNVIRGAGA